MAGGILKGFGITFLVLGLLALLVGLGAAAYGYSQEQDNREQGLFRNGNESRNNEATIQAGATAAAAGLVMTLLGIILAVTGGSMSRRELARTIAGSVAAAHAGSSRTVATTAAPTDATKAKPKPAEPARVVPPADMAAARRSNGKTVAVVLGIFCAVIAVAWAFAATGGFGDILTPDGSKGSNASRGAQLTFNETRQGMVQGGSLNGMAVNAAGENAGDFTVPAMSASCRLVLSWPAGVAAPPTLALEVRQGDELVASGAGASGFAVDLREAAMVGVTFRYAVFPEGDAALVAPQDFDLHITCQI